MQQISQKNLHYELPNSIVVQLYLEIPQVVHWLLRAQVAVLYFKLHSNKSPNNLQWYA